MMLFQDHWRNRLSSLILILFSPSILKCLWNDSVVPSEMKFIAMDFSHTATLYTKMRIAERSFPKKVTFILYSLKSQRVFSFTHTDWALSLTQKRRKRPLRSARARLRAQTCVDKTASFKGEPLCSSEALCCLLFKPAGLVLLTMFSTTKHMPASLLD